MNQPFIYDEVRSEKALLAAAQPDTQITIAGNNAYETINGYMILVTKSDGSPFTGNVQVGVTSSDGHTLLPTQPYHCIRPSFAEKHEDRIIKIKPSKGFGRDFRFRVEATNIAEPLMVYAVAYFNRKK